MPVCSRLPKPFLSFPPRRMGGSLLAAFLATLALLLPGALSAQGWDDEGGGATPETVVSYPGQLYAPDGVDLVADFGFYVYDPDLGISLDAAPGETVSVSFIIGNIGTRVPDRAVVEKIYFSRDLIAGNADDILLTTTSPHVFGYGSATSEKITTDIRIPTGIVRGSYYLLLVADADHAVTETKENNNYDFEGFTILGGDDGADLRIRRVYSDTPVPDSSQPCGVAGQPPCDVCGGEGELPCIYLSLRKLTQRCGLPAEPRARVELLNDSSRDATTGPFGLRAYLADSKLEEDRLVTLDSHIGPGELRANELDLWRMDLAIPPDAPRGLYNLYFQVDSGNNLEEGNEINNYHGRAITIETKMDLEPEALVIHGNRPDGAGTRPFLTVGQPVDIEYRIRNREDSSTVSSYREVVWLADSQGRLLRALLASREGE